MITRKLGRTKKHREAMLKNLSRSLVLDEKVVTTEPRAKEVRRIVDRWVSYARKVASTKDMAKLSGYRKLLVDVGDRVAALKLMNDLAIRSATRISGFVTSARIVSRLGDAAPRMQLRMIDAAKTAKTEKTDKTPVKSRSQDDSVTPVPTH